MLDSADPMKPWIVFRAARAAFRFVTNTRYRHTMLMKIERPEHLFQPDNLTQMDRYPDLFAFAAKELSAVPEPRILSFGCSTGEEVFTLRRYFPGAWIKGVDISRWNIAICNRKLRRNPDPRIRLDVAGSADREPPGAYDAIFCMAVFRHGDLGASSQENCAGLIRFSEFEADIASVSRSLRVGGLLLVIHSNFRFCDTDAYRNFIPIYAQRDQGDNLSSAYYNNLDVKTTGQSYCDAIFRKIEKISALGSKHTSSGFDLIRVSKDSGDAPRHHPLRRRPTRHPS